MGFIKLAMDGQDSQTQAISKFKLPTDGGNPIARTSSDELTRLDPKKLETLYARDGIAFNIINTYMRLIMSASFELKLDKKQYRNYFEKFFDKLGDIGEPLTLYDIFDAVFRNQLIYGNSFIELVYDEKDRVVDLSILDPKRVDYARDTEGRVIVNGKNEPAGFMVDKTNSMSDGDEIPEHYRRKLDMKEGTIFLLPKRVAHFKLYTVGDRFWGIGILEPSYKSSIRKMNMEEGQANSIYKSGFNPLIGYVGGEKKVATPKDLEWVNNLLPKLNYKKTLALPNWVSVEPIKYDQSSVVPETLEYMRINQIEPSGMPMAIASGKGDATNRSTLGYHLNLFQKTLEEIIKRTTSTFDKYITRRIAESRGVEYYPKVEWGPVGPAIEDEYIKNLNQSVKTGTLSPEDVKPKLKSVLGLEQTEDEKSGKNKEKEDSESKEDSKENEKDEKNG